MQKLVSDHQDDWNDLLDNILFAYKTIASCQDSTKCTPFILMYEREARLPIDVTRVQENPDVNLDLDVKVQRMLDLQKQLHDKAYANIEKAQDR